MAGLFVSFEGIDRAGKTTQAALLCEELGERCRAVREPGGTDVGERIRTLLKDRTLELGAVTETLLFAAARAQLVERVIRPALDDGRVVVADRFLDSSLAYQGEGRGLGVGEVAAANRFATGGILPDLTILLELDPSLAAARAGEGDRFELADGLQERVARAYERLAEGEPGRFVRVDAARERAAIHADVLAAVERALAAVAS